MVPVENEDKIPQQTPNRLQVHKKKKKRKKGKSLALPCTIPALVAQRRPRPHPAPAQARGQSPRQQWQPTWAPALPRRDVGRSRPRAPPAAEARRTGMGTARRANGGSARGNRSPVAAVVAVAAGSGRPRPPPPQQQQRRPVLRPAPHRSARPWTRTCRAGEGRPRVDGHRGVFLRLLLVVHNVAGAAGRKERKKERKEGRKGVRRGCVAPQEVGKKKREWTYLVIPLVPRLRDDRLERRELLVRHGQRPKDMLLEQRRARKRQQ